MDFLISDNGDLLFKEYIPSATLRLSFATNWAANTMRIKFTTFDETDYNVSSNSLRISFNTNLKKSEYKCETKDKIEEDLQEIIIALRTELGEINDRKWLGSKLKSIQHEYMYDENLFNKIKQEVQNAISHILPHAKVVVKKEYINDYNKYNNISIYIYNNGLLIFNYYL